MCIRDSREGRRVVGNHRRQLDRSGQRVVSGAVGELPEGEPDLLVELRKSKGMTKEQALKLVVDPLYLATLMIKNGDADGEVAGHKQCD